MSVEDEDKAGVEPDEAADDDRGALPKLRQPDSIHNFERDVCAGGVQTKRRPEAAREL